MTATSQFSFDEVRQVLGGVLGPDLHAKRVDSLCDATLGVLHSGSLAVAAIGHGLAAARGRLSKHAIKQVIGCYRTRGSTSTTSRPCGCPMSSAPAPPSRSPWTGPTSTPTTKP